LKALEEAGLRQVAVQVVTNGRELMEEFSREVIARYRESDGSRFRIDSSTHVRVADALVHQQRLHRRACHGMGR
jgi:hypothetical protein